MYMLQAQNIFKQFNQVKVLKGVSLQVQKGEVIDRKSVV